tara:strand:- start:345 stop:575 length:231 start_codon:yes stop_codon:yes gene_type:complete
MPTIIDTISLMSSATAREYLKVNGHDEGSITEVMVEWEEAQNKPDPIPVTTKYKTTYSRPDIDLNEDDDDDNDDDE